MSTIYQTKAEALATEQRIRDIATSAYLGIATTTTTPPATGAYWYRVTTAGTYTNFKNSSNASIVVSAGDLNGNEVFLEVKDNVATKMVSAKKQGDSAYQVALNNGFVGTEAEWLASLVPATIQRYEDAFSMLPSGNLEFIPREKTESFPHPANDEQWWGDVDGKIIGGTLKKIYIKGSQAGTVNIAFCQINGSTSSVLYNEDVTVPNAGLNIIDVSTMSVPQEILYNSELYVLAGNTAPDHFTSSQINWITAATQKAVFITKATGVVGYGNYDIGIYLEIEKEFELVSSVKALEAAFNDLPSSVVITNEAELQDYITANRDCILPPLNVTISQPLSVPNNTKISGVKGATVIKVPAAASFNVFNFTAASNNIEISSLTLDGQNAITASATTRDEILAKTGIGTSKGIYVDGYAKNLRFESLEIKGFSSAGIHLYRTHAGTYTRTVKITDCVVTNNYIGLWSDVRSEYHTFIGNSFNYNKFGAFIAGGNNFGANNHFDANGVGCVVSGTAGENDSHGSLGNCSFNHNTSFSIYAIDIANGFTFTGCHCFDGNICLDNAKGFNYTGGIVACAIEMLNESPSSFNIISNNIFFTTYGGGSIVSGTTLSLSGNRFILGGDSSVLNNSL